MATYIQHNSITKEIIPANGERFSLEEAQRLVGGYVQIIPLDDEQIMVLNEEGKLMGLPINEIATRIAYEHNSLFHGDFIVGNVLICEITQF